MSPEIKEREDFAQEYLKSPNVLLRAISPLFIVCNDEHNTSVHNHAVSHITWLIGAGMDDFMEKVGNILVEVTRNQTMKEKNEDT